MQPPIAPLPFAPAPRTAPWWQRVAVYWLQPTVMVVALGLWLWLHDSTRPLAWLVTDAVLVLALATIAVFEFLMPARRDWRPSLRQILKDGCYLVALVTLVPAMLSLIRPPLRAFVQRWSPYVGENLWPSRLPLLPKIFLALAMIEFFGYWLHVAQHRFGVLWRFHATHHTANRLNWWKGPVNHPLEQYFLYVVRLTPVMLLGADSEEIGGAQLLWSVVSAFSHANIALRPGLLGWLFGTPEYHVRHHALDIETSRSNYGDALILWDRLFGTFRSEGPQDWQLRLGLHDGSELSLLQQLLLPFRRKV